MPRKKATVIILANSFWYIYNFRLPLVDLLLDQGFCIILCAPSDNYSDILVSMGYTLEIWPVSRKSINIFKEFISLLSCTAYLSDCSLILFIPLLLSRVFMEPLLPSSHPPRIINTITGLGHLFVGLRKRTRILRQLVLPLYKAALSARRSTVIFQNSADLDLFSSKKIVNPCSCFIIPGSGVDIEYFSPMALSPVEYSFSSNSKPIILFPSRIIREKGVFELLEAVQLLVDSRCEFELLIAGSIDREQRSSLSDSEISFLRSHPSIKLLGHVDDMRSLYSKADIVVLPSWREGLSRSLIESAAMQKAIITTNVPGCNDIVQHGISGLLVPLRSPQALSLAFQLLFNDPHLRAKYGKAARERVCQLFEVNLINKLTLEVYSSSLN